MSDNSSLVHSEVFLKNLNSVIIVQILVLIFISVNLLLTVNFFKNEGFHSSARYILFAVTLLSDNFILLMSDILLLLTYFNIAIQVWLCVIISLVVLLDFLVTPVTLTVMTLERYVAICMPLRHAQLCSPRNTMYCILIIHGLSSAPYVVVLLSFFASASLSLYKQYQVCAGEIFILHQWQSHLKSAIHQLYFFIMYAIIVFSYVKIMKVVRTASGETKKSSWKGLKTVILHAVQLLLCLAQFWCPFIESAMLQINLNLFIVVRNESFHTSARYILFAVTLLSDNFILLMSDLLLLLTHFNIAIQVWLCVIISLVVLLDFLVTPVTLTVMTLERYVAICMPLRHAQLCSPRNTVYCILIIHGLSSAPYAFVLLSFFASASLSLYKQYQILVMIFISINLLLTVNFFRNESFHTSARYILFAVTLLSDNFILLMSDLLLLLTHFNIAIQVWLCVVISLVVLLDFLVTPVTLTVMTLERYVAICMPLRHAQLCSPRNTVYCILIIHGLSSAPYAFVLFTFFASASLSLYKQYQVCAGEIFILHQWQSHFRSAIHQLYFFIMYAIIVFSYVKIMKVVRTASGETKKSSWKGLKTVILHAVQLLLCLAQFWCPFIESTMLQINLNLFIVVRNESFHTSARYILFAVTLLSDNFILLMSDILLLLTHFNIAIQVWLCVIISLVVLLDFLVTPVTLTVMTLERYVAICMPLRHAQLCSPRNTVYCILIIHGLSSAPYAFVLLSFFASASLSLYKQYQILVMIFISINLLLTVNFFRNESFHSSARYILFAVTLLSDNFILLMSDLLLLLTHFNIAIQVWLCVIISLVVLLDFLVTPVTLTVMTLERYVAICMPLRHAQLCSPRNTVYCILIIHGLSSAPYAFVLFTFFASASLSLYKQYQVAHRFSSSHSYKAFMCSRHTEHWVDRLPQTDPAAGNGLVVKIFDI
ncbi:uncharacterized protein V6R79_023136 [Siganus canaliculatus]